MEIFQTIWTALTTENETLVGISYFPLSFIDAIVNMLLFTTVLSINPPKKNKIIYVISISLLAILNRLFVPDPYTTTCNIFLTIFMVKFVLKAGWIKSLLSEFLVITTSSILELLMIQLYQLIFQISQIQILYVPLYRFACSLSIYLCVYLIYKAIYYFKFRIKFQIKLESMNTKTKVLFVFNALLGITAIGTQFYLVFFYNEKMPITITIISIVSLLAYFFISIYSLFNITKLETTSQNLEEAQLYNKTLILLHDSMRGFKHDFNNIVQGIGGYIETNNMDGLKKYYSQLLKDCNRVNNLTALNPTVVNNAAIYNIMANKYHRADEIGVQINLGIFIDLNEIENHMKIYEFTRILGILLDNAIEAASECTDKIVHVSFKKEETRNRLVMVIENTYANKDINIDRIFEKDFSTKSDKTNSGLGLWEVRQLLKKNNNLNLFTTKNDEYFIQQFEIYY